MHRGLPQARAFTAKAACCSACFLLTFLPAIASAGPYSGGSGTQAEPYRISAVSDWQELMATPADWASHFVLTADIDLNGVSITPVAPDMSTSYGFDGTPFTGVFDGNDYAIHNADVNMPSNRYVGLFGFLGTAGEIKNLGVENIAILGKEYAGGLVGGSDGTIVNCYSTGSVSGTTDCVGGLVGYSSGGTISNCYSNASVSGTDYYVGGLVGYDYEGTIINCYSTGSVWGSGNSVGGLVGGSDGTIINCNSNASVSGTDYYVGGLVGSNSGAISNCYSAGSVSGADDYMGGLVGYNGTWGTVSDCHSTGPVSGTGSYVGGLLGLNRGAINASFWDVNTSGWTTSDGGAGKTTAEMQDANTFLEAGWDFVGETANGTCNFWLMPGSGCYPVLSTFNGYIPAEPPGSGTEADPYTITDANELGTVWYRPSARYVMANDIDLAGISWSGALVPFFTGAFDGNDYTLRDLDVNVPGGHYVGLFGYTEAAGEIKNLAMVDISVSGVSYVAALVARSNGTISNCYSSGLVAGTGSYVGALVGENGGAVSNCCADGSVSGVDYVGSLVGNNSSGYMSNCYSSGTVSGSRYYVGGLVGRNGRGTISDCHSTASVSGGGALGGLVGYAYEDTIINCCASGSVSGAGSVGGLVGSNERSTISNCHSTGSVSGTGNHIGGLVGFNRSAISDCYSTGSVGGDRYVGGLVGANGDCMSGAHMPGSIHNSYSTGSVSGTGHFVGGLVGHNGCGIISGSYATGSASGDGYVGGIVGSNRRGGAISNCYSSGTAAGTGDYLGGLVGDNYSGAVSDCYSTGSVDGTGSYLGGLVGRNLGTIDSSFWDVNTAGWTTSAGGTPKTTAEMKTQSTFISAGWDFVGETINGPNDIWRMCADELDYPRLTWEYVQGGDFACPDGVNGGDLKVLCEDWLSTYSQALYGADASGDKEVTFDDFAILAERWLSGL